MSLSIIIVYFLALLHPLLATENAVYDAEKNVSSNVLLSALSENILVSASLH